jgi:hypothetical protein
VVVVKGREEGWVLEPWRGGEGERGGCCKGVLLGDCRPAALRAEIARARRTLSEATSAARAEEALP